MENVVFHSRNATGNDRTRQLVDTVRHGVKTHDHTRQDAPEKRVLMTTQELANFLGCSRRHIERLRKLGLPKWASWCGSRRKRSWTGWRSNVGTLAGMAG